MADTRKPDYCADHAAKFTRIILPLQAILDKKQVPNISKPPASALKSEKTADVDASS